MLNSSIESVTITSTPSKSAISMNEITAKKRLSSKKKFYKVTKDFLLKYNFKPVYEINKEWLHSVYRFQNYLIKLGHWAEKIDFRDFHYYARIIFVCHDKNGNYEYEEIFDADLGTKYSDNCRYLEFGFDKYFSFFELLKTTAGYSN